MPEHGGGGATTPEQIIVPTTFLRALTRVLLGQIRGRDSRGRRNEVGALVSRVIYQQGDALDPATAFAVCAVVAEELNRDGQDDRQPNTRLDFCFDRQSGALCWSPAEMAAALGFERATGVKRLAEWRYSGRGPRYIKFSDSVQSCVAYPIVDALEWVRARREATQERFSDRNDVREAS